jgi:hypothetical protein
MRGIAQGEIEFVRLAGICRIVDDDMQVVTINEGARAASILDWQLDVRVAKRAAGGRQPERRRRSKARGKGLALRLDGQDDEDPLTEHHHPGAGVALVRACGSLVARRNRACDEGETNCGQQSPRAVLY